MAAAASPPDFSPGTIIWVPNPYPEGDSSYRAEWLPGGVAPRPAWVPAAVVGSVVSEPGLLKASSLLKPRLSLTVRAREVLPMGDPTVLQDLQDAPVAHLNAPSLSFSMAARALQGRFVTRAAPNLWLSVNPCRVAVDGAGVSLQDPLYMARTYALPPRETRLQRGAAAVEGGGGDGVPIPPHLFDAAEAALGALGGEGGACAAALVFTGEAGGGKSEACKAALAYLLAIPALDACGIARGCLASPSAPEPDRLATRRELLLGGGGPAGPSAGYALLLGAPDVAAAQRDAARRKGPLGGVRNPWFTVGSFSGGLGGVGGTAPLPGPHAPAWSADAHRLLATSAPHVARVLLSTHTVLEAFGCAAVGSAGANSSRYVCSTRLLYGPAPTGGSRGGGGVGGSRLSALPLAGGRPPALRGAEVNAALWEPRRAAGGGALLSSGVPQQGRNFHAFYQLLGGAPRDLRAELRLGALEDYALLHERSWGDALYAGGPPAAVAAGEGAAGGGALLARHVFAHGAPLPARGAAVTPGASVASRASTFSSALWDAEEFAHTQRALASVGLAAGARTDVWRLLSALLMAGNVAFTGDVPEFGAEEEGAAVATPSEVTTLGALLGVDAAELSRALTTESVAVRRALAAPAVVQRLLSPKDARARLAALVAALYAALFAYLVRRSNDALREAAAGEDAVVEAGARVPPQFFLTLIDGAGLEGAAPFGVSAALRDVAGGGAASSGVNWAPGAGVEWDVDTAAHVAALGAHALADATHVAWAGATFHGEADLFAEEGVPVNLAVLVPLSSHMANNSSQIVFGEVGLLQELEGSSSGGGGGGNAGAVDNVGGAALASLAKYFERNTAFLPGAALAAAGCKFLGSFDGGGMHIRERNPVAHAFMVRHVGGDVLYSAAGLAGECEGVDALTGRGAAALLRLLAASSSTLVCALVHAAAGGTEAGLCGDDLAALALGAPLAPEGNGPDGPSPRSRRPPLSLFSTLLRARRVVEARGVRDAALPENGSGLFWVRCLRPNGALVPGAVDVEAIARSAAAAGALDAAAAASASFAAHYAFSDFYGRYHVLLGGALHPTRGGGAERGGGGRDGRVPPPRLPFPLPADPEAARPLAQELLRALSALYVSLGRLTGDGGSEKKRMAVARHLAWGRHRVFLRRPLWEALEGLRFRAQAAAEGAVTAVQAAWRGWRARRAVAGLRARVVRAQAVLRAALAGEQWRAVRDAAVRLQSWWRGRAARGQLLVHYAAARVLCRFCRGCVRARASRRRTHCVRALHLLARGFFVRGCALRMVAAAVRVQAAARRFLVRARLARLRTAAANAFAAVWRGWRWRITHEEVRGALAVSRARRSEVAAVRVITRALKRAVGARMLLKRAEGVAALARGWRRRKANEAWGRLRACVTRAQAAARGWLVRHARARTAALQEVAAELWLARESRLGECAAVANGVAEDALGALCVYFLPAAFTPPLTLTFFISRTHTQSAWAPAPRRRYRAGSAARRGASMRRKRRGGAPRGRSRVHGASRAAPHGARRGAPGGGRPAGSAARVPGRPCALLCAPRG
jgi:hypothetical protein